MKRKILIVLLLDLNISILAGCQNNNGILKDQVIAIMRGGVS